MNKAQYKAALRAHDWYYAYADDYRYHQAGRQQAQQLALVHASLEPPFTRPQLRAWALGLVREQMQLQDDGRWSKNGSATVAERETISQPTADEIDAWC